MCKSSLLSFKVQAKKKRTIDFGAPADAVYENHSRGIVDVLENLLNQVNEQLDGIRKAERVAQLNYEKFPVQQLYPCVWVEPPVVTTSGAA